MLEDLAYVGWWFRELLTIGLWWVFVGRSELARKLDKPNNRLVECRSREDES